MDNEILLRFLLAIVWGGLVGAEREYRSKSAGFRTMIMISLGSCFFTMMSQYIGSPGNPDRIASNIVTGIGFLGAGVIFRDEGRITGITTAATIWAVAAIGMGIGVGHYGASAIASVLILGVLAILPHGEEWIDRLNQSKLYSINCAFAEGKRKHYEQLLRQHRLRYKLVREIKDSTGLSVTWQVQGRAKDHEQFIATAGTDEAIKRFEYS